MKSFKEKLTESHFAEMPMSILKSKTQTVLQEHGHKAPNSRPDNRFNGTSHMFHLDRDHDDEMSSDDRFNAIHDKLVPHGWERSHLHDVHIDTTGEGADVKTYTHPNGAILHHVIAYDDLEGNSERYEMKHKD